MSAPTLSALPLLDAQALRGAFSRFATGVTIVGFEDQDGIHGLTVNAFTSVSLDPPLLLVSIQKTSRSHERLLQQSFSVSILADTHAAAARSFASKDRAGAPDWDRSGRVPRIADAIGWFECEHWAQYDAGDHTLVIGKITAFGTTEGEPLLFFNGALTGLN
ncbi:MULTISPECIES: flavin reductase family protein [unclassified Microbacterium]|uniref:flavin reductase family protein n=1 Tax=unclassified Microbacterium TaxID=2609290 RepID=UPI003139F80E